MGKVNPDLMGPSGLELAGEQHRDRLAAGAVERLLDFPWVIASRPPCRTAIFSRACGWRSIGASMVPRLPVRHVPGEGQVAAPHRPGAAVVGELLGQRLMRPVVLGRDHQAGSVLVEPVHNSRPLHAADAGKAGATMGDQRVDQRAGFVAGGGMHDQPLRLVDDDNVVVLIDDIERDILALGLGRSGFRDGRL